MYVLVGCLTFLTSNYYNPSIHNMCVPGAVCPCQKIIRPLWQPRKLSAKVRALMSSNKRQLQAGGQQDKSILGSSHVLLSGDFCANGQCEVSQFHQSTLAE